MQITEVLNALNDSIVVDIPDGHNGAMGLEYGPKAADGVAGSTGTLVVEAQIQGDTRAGSPIGNTTAIAGVWYPLKIRKNDETVVDNLAAAGIGYCEVTGWARVRARMSIAGNVIATVLFGRP